MPLTRISLPDTYTDAERQAISDGLHEALVQCFDVPRKDRFQIIEVLPARQLVMDPDYMAQEGRSKAALIFQVSAGRPRTEAQRRSFYAELVKRLESSVGIRPADVMVVISTNQTAEWSFSQGIALSQCIEEGTPS